jgi:hypothetical protein
MEPPPLDFIALENGGNNRVIGAPVFRPYAYLIEEN